MAKKEVVEKSSLEFLESAEGLQHEIGKVQTTVEKNKNVIYGVVGALVLAVVGYFGYKYYKAHQQEFISYKNSLSFVRTYSIKEPQWKFFEDFASKDSISLLNITAKEKSSIEKILKSSIARQLFRTEGYYESMNEDDTFIKKALEIIK